MKPLEEFKRDEAIAQKQVHASAMRDLCGRKTSVRSPIVREGVVSSLTVWLLTLRFLTENKTASQDKQLVRPRWLGFRRLSYF